MLIEICTGSNCTMMSAMHLMDQVEDLIEDLDKQRDEWGPYSEDVTVVPIKCRRDCKPTDDFAPVVYIDGEMIQRANSQIIMERIMAKLGLNQRERR